GETGKYKVIVLPASSSLKDGEIKAIKEFVKKGGTVIGGMRTGIADGHGQMLQHGSIDDLFGIKRKSSKLQRGHYTISGGSLNQIPVTMYEKSISAISADVVAKVGNGSPVVFQRNVGK